MVGVAEGVGVWVCVGVGVIVGVGLGGIGEGAGVSSLSVVHAEKPKITMIRIMILMDFFIQMPLSGKL